MQEITSFRVFLSSAEDVPEERELVHRTVEELNRDPLLRGVTRFEMVSWDDPTAYVPLSATLTPQEAISRGFYLPSDCDVVIIILWSRMGTPLPAEYRKPNGAPYLSALEWAYEDAYTASPRPDIFIFRKGKKGSNLGKVMISKSKFANIALWISSFRGFGHQMARS